MATKKKIWSVYEVGASYEGPLTEVEASSERSALDSAASHFGVPRSKLYAIPGALLTGTSVGSGRRSHATKLDAASIADQLTARDRSTLAWLIEDWPWPYRGYADEDMARLRSLGLVEATTGDTWGAPTPLGRAVWTQARQTWIDEWDIGAAFKPLKKSKSRATKRAQHARKAPVSHATKKKEATYSVSYWVPRERYWQFAGEGSQAWAKDRETFLRDTDHKKVRVRKV